MGGGTCFEGWKTAEWLKKVLNHRVITGTRKVGGPKAMDGWTKSWKGQDQSKYKVSAPNGYCDFFLHTKRLKRLDYTLVKFGTITIHSLVRESENNKNNIFFIVKV